MITKIKSFLPIIMMAMLILTGCPDTTSNNNQTPNNTNNSNKISSLQTKIDAVQTGGTLDLSNYTTTETGTVTIDKSITIVNGRNIKNATLIVNSPNVTLKNCEINSVSAPGSSLKIANTKLSSLILTDTETRATSSPIDLIGSVFGTITSNTDAEINLYNFSMNIDNITANNNIQFNILNGVQAETTKYSNNNKISFNTAKLDFDAVSAQYIGEGVAGEWLEYTANFWPADAIRFVRQLVVDCIENNPDDYGNITVPEVPSITLNYCTYHYETEEEMAKDLGDANCRYITIDIPESNYNIEAIKNAISNAGFDLEEEDEIQEDSDELAWLYYSFTDADAEGNYSYSLDIDVCKELVYYNDDTSKKFGQIEIYASVAKQ